MGNLRDNRDTRAARASGAGELRSEQRYDRVAGERQATYATEARHMRDDYGTTMDDTQYKGAEDNRRSFEGAMAKANAQVRGYQGQASKARGDIEGARGSMKTAQAEIDASYKTLEGAQGSLNKGVRDAYGKIASAGSAHASKVPTWEQWQKANTRTVQVYSDNGYEGEYRLTNDTVAGIEVVQYGGDPNQSHGEGYTPGQAYISVEGYGKEAHNSLREGAQKTKQMFDSETNKARAQEKAAIAEAQSAAYSKVDSEARTGQGRINAGGAQLGKSQSALNENQNKLLAAEGRLGVFQENIKAAQARIAAERNKRTAMLNDVRNKYSNRLDGMRATIMAMQKGREDNASAQAAKAQGTEEQA